MLPVNISADSWRLSEFLVRKRGLPTGRWDWIERGRWDRRSRRTTEQIAGDGFSKPYGAIWAEAAWGGPKAQVRRSSRSDFAEP